MASPIHVVRAPVDLGLRSSRGRTLGEPLPHPRLKLFALLISSPEMISCHILRAELGKPAHPRPILGNASELVVITKDDPDLRFLAACRDL